MNLTFADSAVNGMDSAAACLRAIQRRPPAARSGGKRSISKARTAMSYFRGNKGLHPRGGHCTLNHGHPKRKTTKRVTKAMSRASLAGKRELVKKQARNFSRAAPAPVNSRK
jgi:hypothetical protein